MQFERFHKLSHHGLWVTLFEYGKRTREFFERFYFYFSVVFFILGAFSIKQFILLALVGYDIVTANLAIRTSLAIIPYPTRGRGIINNYSMRARWI